MANTQNLTPEYQAGFQAYKRAIPFTANPYGLDIAKNNAWHQGWLAGETAAKSNPTGVVTNLEHPTKKPIAVDTVASSGTVVTSGGNVNTTSGMVLSNTQSASISTAVGSSANVDGNSNIDVSSKTNITTSSQTVSGGGTIILPNTPIVSRVHDNSGITRTQLEVHSGGSIVISGGDVSATTQTLSGTQLTLPVTPTLSAIEVIKNTLKWSLSSNAVEQVSAKIISELNLAGYKVTLS